MKTCLIIGLLLLQGCAVQVLKYGANAYCQAPVEVRTANRILVNTDIAPNKIEVTCAK